MGKHLKGRTFADIVRDVEAEPVVPEVDRSGVVDPSGNRWHQHLADISPTQALELAKNGASIAWDPCGCGGYCGFDWYGAAEVARMVAAGTPKVRCTKRRKGNLSQWANAEGSILVVAEDAVQWGDVING